jgi:ABC-type dipeptide/oligopeptide/nickel transport system permease component
MQRYLVHRLLQLIPSLFVASLFIFLIIQLSPGDPAAMMLGYDATQEELKAERVRLGLDQPLPIRYVIWLSDIARLNLGNSIPARRPVITMIAQAFPNTLRLALAAMSIAVILGFCMGALSALLKDSLLDSLITSLNSLGLAIPSFWLGILMILLFSVNLKWLPPSGVGEEGAGFLHNLKYLVMPVTTIAVHQTAVLARFVRSALIDVMSADYIRTARAKGLREASVVVRHALKNALIPIVTILGIQFARLVGGAVVTESVFAYAGIGRLVVVAILNRDYPVVQATLVLVVLMVLLINLAVDLLYGYLDPRIRFERSRR